MIGEDEKVTQVGGRDASLFLHPEQHILMAAGASRDQPRSLPPCFQPLLNLVWITHLIQLKADGRDPITTTCPGADLVRAMIDYMRRRSILETEPAIHGNALPHFFR